MSLCPPCADAWMRWLDYRPRQPIALITPGRTSVRDVLQAQKFRADDARDLIRSQQALIRSQCERLHTPPPPRRTRQTPAQPVQF